MIKNGLRDLKEQITDMSEEEKKNQKTTWNSRYFWKYSWV